MNRRPSFASGDSASGFLPEPTVSCSSGSVYTVYGFTAFLLQLGVDIPRTHTHPPLVLSRRFHVCAASAGYRSSAPETSDRPPARLRSAGRGTPYGFTCAWGRCPSSFATSYPTLRSAGDHEVR